MPKVVDDAEEEAREIFDDFSKWMKDNTQPERLKAEFKVVSEKIAEVLENARKSAIAVSQSEDFKKTMESRKELRTRNCRPDRRRSEIRLRPS